MDQVKPKASRKTKKDLLEMLDKEKEKTQEYLKQLKYLQADFENYRKRTEKQIQDSVISSKERMVAELLYIIDDLERTLDAGKATNDSTTLLKGVEMIHKNLTKLLESEGLECIKALGKIFDPRIHEIVLKIPRDDCQEDLVLEQVRKGFIFKGRVLRPSIVKVSCRKVAAKKIEQE